MSIVAAYENSATISTTEYSLPNNSTSLTPITADGVYQLFLDLSALTATEEYLLKIYEKVQSAGTQRVVDQVTFIGTQYPAHYVYPVALVLLHGWDMTMDKIAGTDRAIAWSIRAIQ